MKALEIRDLHVRFGDQSVLRGVDLVLEAGVSAVLGPSGCGKTTLLRTIAGFLTAASGSIAVAGKTVLADGVSVPSRSRDVGYVPQEGALFPHLDVARNISFGLDRAQRRGRGGRVTELLDLVELPGDLAHRFPHELSGGQQQRVALARALAPRPALVLLDEPFSSLDAGLREETGRAVVRALAAQSTAGLLVTHDQGEALSLADQVAVMSGGTFRQVDSPRNVYLSPVDEDVARFLGHTALLPGSMTGPGRARCALGEVSVRPAGTPVGGLGSPGASGRFVTEVMVGIRPEQLQVLPLSNHDGTAAEVVEVSFFGHDATVRVAVPGLTAPLVARTSAVGVPQVGDRVRIGVAGLGLAYPDDADYRGSDDH